MTIPDAPREPSPGEIDALAVLWQAEEDGQSSLKLSEIHKLIVARRKAYDEAAPALSTISSLLRSAAAKGLVHEYRRSPDGTETSVNAIRTRGALAATRSPRTSYRAAFSPSVVFKNTLAALINAYPPSKRPDVLLDVAKALQLPSKDMRSIDEVVTTLRSRTMERRGDKARA